MSRSKGPYGRITHQVLTFLHTHPGMRFTAGEVAQQVGCGTAQARMALETLVRDGVIDREQHLNGADRYMYPSGEPLSPEEHPPPDDR